MVITTATNLLDDLVNCYEQEEELKQHIAGVERIRNYINYKTQGYVKDNEMIQEKTEKKKKRIRIATGLLLLWVASFPLTYLINDVQQIKNDLLMVIIFILLCIDSLLEFVAPIIACVLFVKAGKLGNQARQSRKNIDIYLAQEEQYINENNGYYNEAISGFDLRPLKTKLEETINEQWVLKRSLEKETHMDMGYIRNIGSARAVQQNVSRFNVDVAEAYSIYKREQDEIAEMEERIRQRELEEQRHRETQQQIQSLQNSVEQSNRDAERRYRDAQLREDIRNIYRR